MTSGPTARVTQYHDALSVTFLGTGGSWPTAHRNVASIAVKRGPEVVLFDCGEGTQRQFQKSKLSYQQVSKIFVSHLHGDHFLGITGLVQTMSLNERADKLSIFGPRGLRGAISAMVSLGYFRPAFPVDVHELKDKEVLDFGDYHVEARKIKHNVENFGYALVEKSRPGRFNKERALELGVPEGPQFSRLHRGEDVTLADDRVVKSSDVVGSARLGRKIVYSGDAVPCEAMVELALEADLLIHDSTYGSDFPNPSEYGHSTSQQAAWIAEKANVDTLFLTHFSARYRDVDPLLADARKIHAKTEAAEDFREHVVPFRE